MKRGFQWGAVALFSVLVIVGVRLTLVGHTGRDPVALEVGDSLRYDRGVATVPGRRWERLDAPVDRGWSADGLREARSLYESLDTAALFVVHRGLVVVDWGSTRRPYTAQSVRKSLLSALVGIQVERGAIDLAATLDDLEIRDEPPLLDQDGEATVRDLLLSRSGVYHSAIYEHGSWKRNKPAPGAHRPGSIWYYNNWGFNLIGSLLEQTTGRSVASLLARDLAGPLQMQDFEEAHVTTLTRDTLTERIVGNESLHPAHIVDISTRDLARFGLLYLNEGLWSGKRVVPQGWVQESWQGMPVPNRQGELYGYLWWTYTEEHPYWSSELMPMHVARGARGHWLAVFPKLDLVIAHQVSTRGLGLPAQLRRRFLGARSVDVPDIGRLFSTIAAAAPEAEARPLAGL
ncbi:MAG: serine hydrolase [Acidobacteriota bacterium]